MNDLSVIGNEDYKDAQICAPSGQKIKEHIKRLRNKGVINDMATNNFKTDKKSLEDIGIFLTDEQYDDLCNINILMQTEENRIPVYHILLLLKTLNLLPTTAEKSKDDSGKSALTIKEYKEIFKKKFGCVV